MTTRGAIVVGKDLAIIGQIRRCQVIEVHGYVEGEVSAQNVIIREGGRIFGKIKAEQAEIHGELQGSAFVKNLMTIGRGGTVSGQVQYGQIAMELGANFSGEMKNVPPSIFGDLDLTVARGQAVQITVADLTAADPDDDASQLVYTVSKAAYGLVETSSAAGSALASFTQADLEAGRIAFRHDGSSGANASFDVVVADHTGANSGPAKTVYVTVR